MFNDSRAVIHSEGRWAPLRRVCFLTYSNTASSMLTLIFVLSFVEDQKVSAPDVALYGLNVIIPLMSSEVLKVSPRALQFWFRHS